MAQKKKVFIQPKQDLGIFLYTSLMLILLTFFIVLASMSIQDARKQKMALDSLTGSFGLLPGGRSPIKQDLGRDILRENASLKGKTVDVRSIQAALSENGVTNQTSVTQGSLGVTITLKSNVLFKTGTAELGQGSHTLLDSLARVLSRTDNDIIITGHTDSIPVETPPYYSNWELSAARSLAVLNYLGKKGISPARLAAYGMGAQRPITSNSDEYGRNLNRRVDITLKGDMPAGVDLERFDSGTRETGHSVFYKGHRFRLEEQ